MLRSTVALLLLIVLFEPKVKAQNIDYARQVIKTLCSDEYAGRGYVKEGDAKAAELIRSEFRRNKLIPLGENYFQRFNFPVVSYPEEIDILVDDVNLVPGHEVLINPGCPKTNGVFKVLYIDSATLDNSHNFKKLTQKNLRGYFLVVDGIKNLKLIHPERIETVLQNKLGAKGLLYLQTEHLLWSVATQWADFPIIQIKKDRIKQFVLKIQVNVNPLYKHHNTQNVLGYFKGSQYPDSFVVFTAHYDHLGMLGSSAIFPGANDNASGVAMVLDLVQHYAQNPPKYSVLFIAFAAEEAGLIGSQFYTINPIIPLKKMCLLLNLDLMATGDKGMTAVNATVYPELFANLQQINNINHLLPVVNPRGKAQNSDHYYFSEAGVKAFFFYLMGNYNAYHDVNDTYQAVTLTKYNEAFKLIQLFADEVMVGKD